MSEIGCMENRRLEKLLGWLSIGSMAVALGLALLAWGWFLPLLRNTPVYYRGTAVDPNIALGGGLCLVIIGIFLVGRAIIGKLRSDSKR